MKKAFTIFELVTVIAIIGILAAIIIPTFRQTQAASLKKAEMRGEVLSDADKKIIQEWGNVPIAVVEKSIAPVMSTAFQTVVTDGKTFYLIPKKYYEEVRIGSDSFLLVPQ